MGEARGLLPGLEFNRSVKVECRAERLSSEGGALVVREVLERSGVARLLARELVDPREQDKITHPMFELVQTAIALLAQGWRDQDDVDPLRDDAVMRLAVSERRGVAPLEMRPRDGGQPLSKNPPVPDGLTSQPTLSRLMATLSDETNRGALRRALLDLAVGGLRTGRTQRRDGVVLDVDSVVEHGGGVAIESRVGDVGHRYTCIRQSARTPRAGRRSDACARDGRGRA
jgi:hypothetical protein